MATPGRVTQSLVELLSLPLPPLARVTQTLVETLVLPPSTVAVRVSHIPIELVGTDPAATRVSQTPLETVGQWTAPLVGARVTQAPVEIVYPFGCYDSPVPHRPPCPQKFPVG